MFGNKEELRQPNAPGYLLWSAHIHRTTVLTRIKLIAISNIDILNTVIQAEAGIRCNHIVHFGLLVLLNRNQAERYM